MKKANTVLFLAMLLIFACIVTLFPSDERIIEKENRSFSQFPDLTAENVFGGGFGKQFEEWVADRVWYRADFVTASMSIVRSAGVTPPAPKQPTMSAETPVETPPSASSTAIDTDAKDAEQDGVPLHTGAAPSSPPTAASTTPPATTPSLLPTSPPSTPPATQPTTSPSTPPPSEQPGASSAAQPDGSSGAGQIGLNDPPPPLAAMQTIQPKGAGRLSGSMLAFDDRLVELFVANPNATERYSEVLNLYRAALGDSTRMFSILVPTQIEFLPEVYRELCDPQIETIETANSFLSEGVIPVDAYTAIARHVNEYVYFRTDHHWTALGSYYAYTAFAQAAGIDPIPLSDYDVVEVPGFLGFLYERAPAESMEQNPDTIYAYSYKGSLETSVPLLQFSGEERAEMYGLFLGGDLPIITITTSVGNGRTAIVVKDSFANCFVPWLAPHYERIIVLDPREFEGSVIETASRYDDVDLIFMNYTLAISYGVFIEYIFNIME